MPAVQRPRGVVAWPSAVFGGAAAQPYGGLDLREGDRDPGPGAVARYGGRERPDLVDTAYVHDLHRDLRELGFLQAPEDSPAFGRHTRWAVQEFQRYARLPWAAVERVPATTVTTSPISLDGRALTVETRAGLPDRPPFRIQVEDEIMEVTALLGDTGLTVTRGVEDTAPVAHPAGAEVSLPRWSDRLAPVKAGPRDRYLGRATGVVNARTRQALQRWKRDRRRCPVVVEAWDLWRGRPDRIHTIPAADGRPARRADNVWQHDEVRATTPIFLVRDLTRAWRRPSRPPTVPGHPDLDVLGEVRVRLGRYGPRAVPEARHTWRPEGELLPEHLLPRGRRAGGPTLRTLVRARGKRPRRALSTYKVIRAVAEAESAAHFDALTANGDGFLALGPFGWSAGPVLQPHELPVPPRPTWPVAEGDLWGFLSLLKALDHGAFHEAAGRFGLDVADDWAGDGRALLIPSRGTYATRPATPAEHGPSRPVPPVSAEYDVFRGWHWFHRFQMAARTVDGFRRAMWHMSRLRLRHILQTPWYAPAEPADDPATALTEDASNGPAAALAKDAVKAPAIGTARGAAEEPAAGIAKEPAEDAVADLAEGVAKSSAAGLAGNPDQGSAVGRASWRLDRTVADPRAPGGTRPVLIGDVVSSERATALILEWHVRRPADIVVPDPDSGPLAVRAGDVLRAAVARADLPANPATWGDAEEEALIAGLIDHARHRYGPDHPLVASLRGVHDWPSWEGNPRGYTLPVELLPDASDGGKRKLLTTRHSFALDTTGLPKPPR